MTLGDWQWLTVGWTLECRLQLQQNELRCAACLEWLTEHKRAHFTLIFTRPFPPQCWKVTAPAAVQWHSRVQVMLYPKSHCSQNTWLLLSSKETAPQLQKRVRASGICQCSQEKMGSCWEQNQLNSWCCWTPSTEHWQDRASYYREQSTFTLSY